MRLFLFYFSADVLVLVLFFQSNNFHMMLLLFANDVLFFSQFSSAMLVLPSDFLQLFSNRRVTTGHTFSATTVKFNLCFFSVVKKVGKFSREAPSLDGPNRPFPARGRPHQDESQKTSILGSVCVHLQKCLFFYVFVFLLVYFSYQGVTQRHRIIQFGVFLFFFSFFTLHGNECSE